jgi:hypothetical protein
MLIELSSRMQPPLSAQERHHIQDRLGQLLDLFGPTITSVRLMLWNEAGERSGKDQHARMTVHVRRVGVLVVEDRGSQLLALVELLVRRATIAVRRRVAKRYARRHLIPPSWPDQGQGTSAA